MYYAIMPTHLAPDHRLGVGGSSKPLEPPQPTGLELHALSRYPGNRQNDRMTETRTDYRMPLLRMRTVRLIMDLIPNLGQPFRIDQQY